MKRLRRVAQCRTVAHPRRIRPSAACHSYHWHHVFRLLWRRAPMVHDRRRITTPLRGGHL